MTRTTRTTAKDEIARHAQQLFREHGYADTSVRQIAAAAAIDPALVIRYFGSKEQLFLHVIHIDSGPVCASDEPLAGLGLKLMDRLIVSNHDDMKTYQLLLRAAMNSEIIRVALLDQFERSFMQPLAQALGPPSGALRARLIASALFGVMFSVALYGDESVLTMPGSSLAGRYAPALQAIIDTP